MNLEVNLMNYGREQIRIIRSLLLETVIILTGDYIKRPDWNYFCFALTHKETLDGYIVLKLYQEEGILKGHILDIYSKFNIKMVNKLINLNLNKQK